MKNNAQVDCVKRLPEKIMDLIGFCWFKLDFKNPPPPPAPPPHCRQCQRQFQCQRHHRPHYESSS